MKRLCLAWMVLSMIALCAPAAAHDLPYDQQECEEGCGGGGGSDMHPCNCTVLDGFPFVSVDPHYPVVRPLPCCPIGSTSEDDNIRYWRTFLGWIASLGDAFE